MNDVWIHLHLWHFFIELKSLGTKQRANRIRSPRPCCRVFATKIVSNFELNSGPFKVQTTTFQQQIEHLPVVTQKNLEVFPLSFDDFFFVFFCCGVFRFDDFLAEIRSKLSI